MNFDLEKSIVVLENTPHVLLTFLNNLSDVWVNTNEGENTWTVKEVVAHLIISEKTNWMTRISLILHNPDKVFETLDMNAHFELAANNSIQTLLNQFFELRKSGLESLKSYNLSENDLIKTGIHPKTGEVAITQIIATWITHDMSHLAQIARIIAKQNTDYVGSFKEYLKILH